MIFARGDSFLIYVLTLKLRPFGSGGSLFEHQKRLDMRGSENSQKNN